MIEVRRWQDPADGRITVEVKGHAGMNEHGQDVPCAVVSSAVLLLARVITECGITMESSIGPGLATLTFEGSRRAWRISSAFMDHCEDAAVDYPEYIKTQG